MSFAVRPLEAGDLPACRRVHRAAFGAFAGLADPDDFRPGADAVGPRWRAWPEGCFVLEDEGEIVAGALMMHWGSVCILGPVTVHPDYWSRGAARRLMDRLTATVDATGFAFTGLFTHLQSPKHIRLYESFGFVLQRPTLVMSKAVVAHLPPEGLRLAAKDTLDRDLAHAAAVTDGVFAGLDLGREISEVAASGIGETILIEERGAPAGVAICHHGPESEASEGQLLVKFAAATPGRGTEDRFRHLLEACEGLASARGAERIIAGNNAGRRAAYEAMKEAGFRSDMNGIAMMRPATDGYNIPETFAIDDWR